jgi:phage protein D
MSTSSILSTIVPSTDYYAPDYQIEVEGQELDPESKGDLLEVKITMDLNNLTHFDLTVNNWDDKHLTFKYSDTKTFDLGNRIHIAMGYAGNLVRMMNGLVTSMTPRFPESGPPTIVIGGEDRMVKLKDRKPKDGEQKQFLNKLDSDIVEIIARRNSLVPKITQTSTVHDIVVQKNQDDATFLMERAKRIDYDCYIDVDPDSGKDALYFGPPTDLRGGSKVHVYVFEWGKTLINFNPTISLNHQVGSVTVKGWDATTKSLIKYTAGAKDLPTTGGSGETGPSSVATRLQDREDIVVDRPVRSQKEAQDLATALLRERAYSYVTGNGQVIGIPDLRPGNNVELQGLGQRFSGTYQVTKVEHTLGGSGYVSSFDARNYQDGGTNS